MTAKGNGQRDGHHSERPLTDPTPENVQKYVLEFDVDNADSEAAIAKIISIYPANTDMIGVLLKAIVINGQYSTHVKQIERAARMIADSEIDSLLAKGDIQAVREIGTMTILDDDGKEKERSIYSFATKYCALHRPEYYAIYDRMVAETLWAYKNDNLSNEMKLEAYVEKLRDYEIFFEMIKNFRDRNDLSEFSFRSIDKFLWKEGKRRKQAVGHAASDSPG